MKKQTKTRKMRKTHKNKTRYKTRYKLRNKTKKHTPNMVTVNCSPKNNAELNEYTCYTDKALFKLRDLWNARHPDVKITTNNAKEIHAKLSQLLSDVCNKESCWLKQKSDFGELTSETSDIFAPDSPAEWKANPNEWLSSIDIIKVMKQYEKAYKCFEFIGPSPVDFDTRKMYGECVWNELCKFNIQEQIKSGKTKIGIIFNTDPHDKPGQHWISMFINIKKQNIFFFDSTGDRAPKEVKVLIDRIIQQGNNLNPPIHFKYDDSAGVKHQKGNTECGVYSLYFIVHMLEDKTTNHYLKTHLLPDKHINKFRKVYFN
jgi:hypothetical protein